MSAYPRPRIYSCDEWGARAATGPPVPAGKPGESIAHHTAGHAAGATLQQAFAYARSIQAFHMDGHHWKDSGHNFLVTRSGFILEGRRGSLDAVEHGQMIVSAHCVGHNGAPGVEHEHTTEAHMTPVQLTASTMLHAWIADRCGIAPSQLAKPHGDFNLTACPAQLRADLPALRVAVAEELARYANPLRKAQLRTWILASRAIGWPWQRIQATKEWLEYRRLGGQ